MPLALPSLSHPLPINRTFIYIQTTLICPLLLLGCLTHRPTYLTFLRGLFDIKGLEDFVKSNKVDLANINKKLETLLEENTQLKKMEVDRDEEKAALKFHINSLEQHNHLWSIWVMGLPLTVAEEKSFSLTKEKLFQSMVLAILRGAAAEGDPRKVPSNA
jgi:hypothetical protein